MNLVFVVPKWSVELLQTHFDLKLTAGVAARFRLRKDIAKWEGGETGLETLELNWEAHGVTEQFRQDE